MGFVDFAVRYDPDIDEPHVLTDRILHSIVLKPLKRNKPRVIFIGGDSGEGKSMAALKLMEIILRLQGIKIEDHIDDVNIYTPLEYPKKIQALIQDKRLKKVNVFCMHEAREIVKAKKWQDFLAQSVNDITAMTRSIKRLCTIIVSQFIRDITSDTRYSLTYYCMVNRPIQRATRLRWYVLWKDDRDLEKPRLRRRRLTGYVIDKNGKYRKFIPTFLEIKMPEKHIAKEFQKHDYDAKKDIIKGKLERLIKDMEKDAGIKNKKVEAMVKYYMDRPDSLQKIGKVRRKKWTVNPDFKDIHELAPTEVEQFQHLIAKKLNNIGFFGEDNDDMETKATDDAKKPVSPQ